MVRRRWGGGIKEVMVGQEVKQGAGREWGSGRGYVGVI